MEEDNYVVALSSNYRKTSKIILMAFNIPAQSLLKFILSFYCFIVEQNNEQNKTEGLDLNIT